MLIILSIILLQIAVTGNAQHIKSEITLQSLNDEILTLKSFLGTCGCIPHYSDQKKCIQHSKICSENSQCCSNYCLRNSDGHQVCQVKCKGEGDYCKGHNECCKRRCQYVYSNSVGKICNSDCKSVKDTCNDDKDCCSGSCSMLGNQKVKECAENCKPLKKSCVFGEQCCSKFCIPQAYVGGTPLCGNCIKDGKDGLCIKDTDCCNGTCSISTLEHLGLYKGRCNFDEMEEFRKKFPG